MRIVLTALAMMLAPAAYACGAESDCRIGDRIYRISMPEGVEAPVGAVIWSHGYRGSAAGVMRNGSLRKMVHAQGLALIAAEGVNGGWDLPKGPSSFDSDGEAEFAYFEDIIADAEARFGIDTSRLIASGFSAGGMMVWNLACARPDSFAGFIPFSGTFWLEPPEICGPDITSIVHIHGDRDTTVPLDGRAIRETKQGRVQDALDMYAEHGGFGAATQHSAGALECSEQVNGNGNILEFCLFEGGHSFRTEYLDYGIEQLKAAGQL
ncbi:MAG: polyhydroxybutyrate depolymerase [Sulfitobacter sp.]